MWVAWKVKIKGCLDECETLGRFERAAHLSMTNRCSFIPYLRAICTFLFNIGKLNGLDNTLYEESLSLHDRVAFACCFLPRKDLREYLDVCVEKCLNTGNLEGILITGLERRGIDLLQSYVDKTSDVQAAAVSYSLWSGFRSVFCVRNG